MGELGDRLDKIHVRVRVPGTPIQGELHHRGEIGISFDPDSYQWLRESRLAHYLATVARLLYAGWTREYRAAISSSLLPVDPPEEVRNRAYEQARDEVEASGSSADGRVTVSAVGLRNFTARITPGTIRELTEQEFVSRAREAATAFLADHRAQIRELKLAFFSDNPVTAHAQSHQPARTPRGPEPGGGPAATRRAPSPVPGDADEEVPHSYLETGW